MQTRGFLVLRSSYTVTLLHCHAAGVRCADDMFNASSGEWSHGNLSLGRMRLQAATVGTKAFFVSGVCTCT